MEDVPEVLNETIHLFPVVLPLNQEEIQHRMQRNIKDFVRNCQSNPIPNSVRSMMELHGRSVYDRAIQHLLLRKPYWYDVNLMPGKFMVSFFIKVFLSTELFSNHLSTVIEPNRVPSAAELRQVGPPRESSSESSREATDDESDSGSPVPGTSTQSPDLDSRPSSSKRARLDSASEDSDRSSGRSSSSAGSSSSRREFFVFSTVRNSF